MTPFSPRSFAVTLTTADALAWETLPRDGRRSDFWLLMGLAVGGGMVLGLMPDDWSGGWRFWAIGGSLCVLAFCLFVFVRTLASYLKARSRIPVSIAQDVNILSHGIEAVSGETRHMLAQDAIGAVVATPTHLFVASRDDLIILPLAAFESPEDLQQTAIMIEAALHDDD